MPKPKIRDTTAPVPPAAITAQPTRDASRQFVPVYFTERTPNAEAVKGRRPDIYVRRSWFKYMPKLVSTFGIRVETTNALKKFRDLYQQEIQDRSRDGDVQMADSTPLQDDTTLEDRAHAILERESEMCCPGFDMNALVLPESQRRSFMMFFHFLYADIVLPQRDSIGPSRKPHEYALPALMSPQSAQDLAACRLQLEQCVRTYVEFAAPYGLRIFGEWLVLSMRRQVGGMSKSHFRIWDKDLIKDVWSIGAFPTWDDVEDDDDGDAVMITITDLEGGETQIQHDMALPSSSPSTAVADVETKDNTDLDTALQHKMLKRLKLLILYSIYQLWNPEYDVETAYADIFAFIPSPKLEMAKSMYDADVRRLWSFKGGHEHVQEEYDRITRERFFIDGAQYSIGHKLEAEELRLRLIEEERVRKVQEALKLKKEAEEREKREIIEEKRRRKEEAKRQREAEAARKAEDERQRIAEIERREKQKRDALKAEAAQKQKEAEDARKAEAAAKAEVERQAALLAAQRKAEEEKVAEVARRKRVQFEEQRKASHLPPIINIRRYEHRSGTMHLKRIPQFEVKSLILRFKIASFRRLERLKETERLSREEFLDGLKAEREKNEEEVQEYHWQDLTNWAEYWDELRDAKGQLTEKGVKAEEAAKVKADAALAPDVAGPVITEKDKDKDGDVEMGDAEGTPAFPAPASIPPIDTRKRKSMGPPTTRPTTRKLKGTSPLPLPLPSNLSDIRTDTPSPSPGPALFTLPIRSASPSPSVMSSTSTVTAVSGLSFAGTAGRAGARQNQQIVPNLAVAGQSRTPAPPIRMQVTRAGRETKVPKRFQEGT